MQVQTRGWSCYNAQISREKIIKAQNEGLTGTPDSTAWDILYDSDYRIVNGFNYLLDRLFYGDAREVALDHILTIAKLQRNFYTGTARNEANIQVAIERYNSLKAMLPVALQDAICPTPTGELTGRHQQFRVVLVIQSDPTTSPQHSFRIAFQFERAQEKISEQDRDLETNPISDYYQRQAVVNFSPGLPRRSSLSVILPECEADPKMADSPELPSETLEIFDDNVLQRIGQIEQCWQNYSQATNLTEKEGCFQAALNHYEKLKLMLPKDRRTDLCPITPAHIREQRAQDYVLLIVKRDAEEADAQLNPWTFPFIFERTAQQ